MADANKHYYIARECKDNVTCTGMWCTNKDTLSKMIECMAYVECMNYHDMCTYTANEVVGDSETVLITVHVHDGYCWIYDNISNTTYLM